MNEQKFTKCDLYERTMEFAVRVIKMTKALPKGIEEDVIAHQVTKSATSIGANYREASHAKSPSDFAAKLKICEGEAKETLYWLQLIIRTKMQPKHKMQDLEQEARELVAIFTAAARRACFNRDKKQPNFKH